MTTTKPPPLSGPSGEGSLGESITSSFSTMINCLETLTQTVKQQSAHFKQLTDSLHGTLKEQSTETHSQKASNSPQTVHLNVGGTVFVTNKETLTRQDKDSFFSAMINGDLETRFQQRQRVLH
eukprot:TRINITY_DN67125_c3_g1_i2.p1 TRINITY_DN67125_c3_g1~~TRINITY_DN67125_c3_g1_i2.p1  ORF type:complete len:123 (-),score=26.56 TRINITY_DN67125_c3_g1_i2:86-454(-)